MKLGLFFGYWGSGPPPDAAEAVAEAERLGFDSVWTAEAYGSDALSPLAWWGAATSTVKLGTAIAQISARTPAATAMAAITMDHLSGGRFILGLGASGPQVVEGWYGAPYPRPLERTREYVAIVRAILAREKPVEFQGRHYALPNPDGAGLGKALRATVHPLRADLPIYLAAAGPKNVALAAEIADGWIPIFYSPGSDEFYRQALAEGFSRRGARATPQTFEVAAPLPVVIGELEASADQVRPLIALYVGGMGARGANFYYEIFARLGWEDVCRTVQDLYLDGKYGEAAAAVPTRMVEDVALIGPLAKVRDEAARWKETLLTTALVQGGPADLERIAEALG